MKFDDAFEIVVKEEGGDKVTDDPNDPGGLTKWGVSLRAHPELGRAGILALTKAKAKKIYKKNYWDAIKATGFPLKDRLFIFDMAINLGVTGAAKIIQKAANARGAKLSVDGVIGPLTLSAVKKMDPIEFLVELSVQRLAFYRSLDTHKFYGNGWERRVLRIAFKTGSKA